MRKSGIGLLHAFSHKHIETDGSKREFQNGSFFGFFIKDGLFTASHNLNIILNSDLLIANYSHEDFVFHSHEGNATPSLCKTKYVSLPYNLDLCVIDFNCNYAWLKNLNDYSNINGKEIIGEKVIFFEPNPYCIDPLVHEGFVSGFSNRNYSISPSIVGSINRIVIDGPVVPGCSGSPVLLKSNLNLVGMIIQERSPENAINPENKSMIDDAARNIINNNISHACAGEMISQLRAAHGYLLGLFGELYQMASRGRGYGGYAVTINAIKGAVQ